MRAVALPALSVKADLIVTSPPFESIREYGGHTNDMVVNGGHSGASFDAALWFMREGGLRLYDRIIAVKSAMPIRGDKRQFQNWDFVFVFTKGAPRAFNRIKDRRNTQAGNVIRGWQSQRDALRKRRDWDYKIPEYSKRTAVWQVLVGSELVVNHPAPMSIR